MENINLLEFLNKIKTLDTLDFATCSSKFTDFLDFVSYDEQFTQRINLGVMYTQIKTLENYTVIDGLSNLISVSLLLHAICECHKKTTQKNEAAIKTIRKKYLIVGDRTKLRLPMDYQVIYEKIIFGERLSGKEKKHPLFQLLHKYWEQIKEHGLQASYIFSMLHKVQITMVEVSNVNKRELYYTLNKSRNINQIKLVDNFAESENIYKEWSEIKEIYKNNNSDIEMFMSDFFKNKFNYQVFEPSKLYEYVVNYFETMSEYQSNIETMVQLKNSAKSYYELINIDVKSDLIKNGLIQIKLNNGSDTYPYLLSVYEDYKNGNLSEATLSEILTTVADYLKNRKKSDNNIDFNELIKYLNAFLACK